MEQFHGTTIVSVRRGDQVCIGGDGQVTLGNTVMKGNARKVRRLYQIRYWPDSRAEQLTPSPYLSDLMGNLKSTKVISPGPQLSSQKTGGRIECCDDSRPSSRSLIQKSR